MDILVKSATWNLVMKCKCVNITGIGTPNIDFYAMNASMYLWIALDLNGMTYRTKSILAVVEERRMNSSPTEIIKYQQLLDPLRAPFTDDQSDAVNKDYLEALGLRADFFPSFPSTQRSVVLVCKLLDPAKDRRMVIFSGSDPTCFLKDASYFFTQKAIDSVPKADQKSLKETIRMQGPISKDVKQSVDQFKLCIGSVVSSKQAQNFNSNDLRIAIEELASFQKRTNSRAKELMNESMEHLKRAGENMQLQRGCKTGEIIGIIESPTEKVECFKDGRFERPRSVYIGRQRCVVDPAIKYCPTPASTASGKVAGERLLNLGTHYKKTKVSAYWVPCLKVTDTQLKLLLDQVRAPFTDDESGAVKKVYLEAFRLQVFFPSLPISQRPVVPVCKMLDLMCFLKDPSSFSATGESKIESPVDKVECLKDTLLKSGRLVSDLLCFLGADIRIIFDHYRSNRRFCNHFCIFFFLEL